ncbi:TPA: helix-turn-helix domain-containing protein, partial [Escherichia coli]
GRCPSDVEHRQIKGTGATEIAHQLSIARSTVYKILEDERAS